VAVWLKSSLDESSGMRSEEVTRVRNMYLRQGMLLWERQVLAFGCNVQVNTRFPNECIKLVLKMLFRYALC
jgi:hypothetical protein